MNKSILIISFFICNFLAAQELTKDFVIALKGDDATTFNTLISEENKNDCFDAGSSDYTLLALTLKTNAQSCFNLLLEQKVDLEKECTGKTPLMYAAKYGRLEMAKALIENGAKLDAKNNKGRTAFSYATKYKQEAMIDYFKSL